VCKHFGTDKAPPAATGLGLKLRLWLGFADLLQMVGKLLTVDRAPIYCYLVILYSLMQDHQSIPSTLALSYFQMY